MSLLIDAVLKSSLVLLLSFAVLALLRGQSASVRHWFLAVALGLAAAQPILGLVVPSWALRESPQAPVPVEADGSGPAVSFDILLPSQGAPDNSARDSHRLVLVVWLIGAILNVGILLTGVTRLAWLGSRATPAGRLWLDVAKSLRRTVPSRPDVRVVVTEHPALLVTWGVLR
ncbi:MAG: hypothetical protein H0T71_15300, partial [Acidobacteria bacterium]|nr:hypothetical protein [Acidobacteriota bacterium]